MGEIIYNTPIIEVKIIDNPNEHFNEGEKKKYKNVYINIHHIINIIPDFEAKNHNRINISNGAFLTEEPLPVLLSKMENNKLFEEIDDK